MRRAFSIGATGLCAPTATVALSTWWLPELGAPAMGISARGLTPATLTLPSILSAGVPSLAIRIFYLGLPGALTAAVIETSNIRVPGGTGP